MDMDLKKTQETLLSLLPMWNYRIAKPFKQLLDNGISIEMYYCIKTLQWYGKSMTMSELAKYTKISKQQATQIVNKLVEQGLVGRIYDSSNRRIINIKLTDKAIDYIEHFVEYDASCFKPLLEQMNKEDLTKFQNALEILVNVFSKLPCEHGVALS